MYKKKWLVATQLVTIMLGIDVMPRFHNCYPIYCTLEIMSSSSQKYYPKTSKKYHPKTSLKFPDW